MSARVYVLLDTVNGKSEQVTQVLRGKPGVILAEPLEGSPDVIMVVEAPRREKLAKLTNEALASVELLTENLQLLPARIEYRPDITLAKASSKRSKN
jgi:hypothetical protein